jgi:hypothetical protein
VAGLTLRGHNEALTGSCAATAHQGMGAMIVLAFFVLWAARRHLGDVFGKAVGRAPQVDDSSEIMSYRAAVIGLVLGLAFVLGWFVASGMPFLGAVAFMAGALCIFFAVTRIVAQGGVGFTAGQMIPQPFVVYGVGSEFMGPAGLTSLAYTYSWAAEIRTSVMTSAMNGLKLADSALADAQAGRKARRLLFWAMMLAIVAGLAGAIWTTLKLNYTHGGANLRMFGVPVIAFRFLEDKLRNPIASDIIWERWAFTGIGGTVMSVLVLLRHRLTWWPVHYVGFCIGDAWVMGWAWFGVFFCWLLKLFILWLGGMTLYNRLKPLFVGMILGQLMCGAFWLVVDLITGEVGNYVYIGVP